MIDTYWRLLEDLFAYEEFRLAVGLFRAALWLLVGMIVIVVSMHILYLSGYQSPLYKKRSPRQKWNRNFFSMSLLTISLIIMVIFGLEWLLENTVVD